MTLVGCILSLIGAFALGGWAARAWYAISDRLAARRKRNAEERETWRESVTKQTMPPPIAAQRPVIVVGETFQSETPRMRQLRAKVDGARADIKPDPDLSTYIALAVPKAPSPTAPASAAKVRRATKRNRK